MKWGADATPFAGWIWVDFRAMPISVGVLNATHDLECRTEHGCCRWWIFARTFRDDVLYRRMLKEGFEEFPVDRFRRYPGASRLVAEFFDSDSICIVYNGSLPTFDDIFTLETAMGLDDPPSSAVAKFTGPSPRVDDSVPEVELQDGWEPVDNGEAR